MIPANVKHWHGAKADSWFSHIAVEVPGEDCRNEWCEPVTDEEYRRVEGLIASFLTEYRQYHYNFLGLPLIALQIPWQCRRHFVCSQFVAYLLTRGGVARFSKDYSLVRPEDFYTIRGLHQVFKGTLREYLDSCGEAAAV